MRVAMIFECGPRGPDEQVCTHFAKRLNPDIEIKTVTLSSKPSLISDCGEAARVLSDEGWDPVVIIWDLYPGHGRKPCRRQDRKEILAALSRSRVTSPPARLVCIEAMLESWLLGDGTALSSVLSRPTHPANVKRQTHPERIKNPKKLLVRLFNEHLGRPYSDRQDAVRVARAMDLEKVRRRCSTFERFARIVTRQ